MSSLSPLSTLRAEFPHTAHTTYLNHAATGVYSRRVVEALHAFIENRHGQDIEYYLAFEPVVTRTLGRLGRLLNAAPERIEFTPNTTEAISALAEGFDWQPGDRVAVPACEFPANVYPFLGLRDRGVEVDFIPHMDGVVTLESIERTLTPHTRIVSVSWVQFLSGYRLDLKAVSDLVHARGAFLCVDAIQGVGALRLDVQAAGVDFLACGVQKWLMATRGLGFLYLTEEMQGHIRPRAGWLNVPVDWDDFFNYDLRFYPDARRFRLGTINQLGIAALDAALGLYEEAGVEACEGRVLENTRLLGEGFERLGLPRYGSDDPVDASGIITVRHPEPEALFGHLTAQGIQHSIRNRLLRFSPTWYNSREEIERVLEEVKAFETRRGSV